MKNKTVLAHLLALAVSIVWGMTFVASKNLLNLFSPVELLIYRFVIGFFALLAMKPKLLSFQGWKREGLMALAGLSGVTLYFLGENYGLQYTLAANVSVIVSVAPILTAILAALFLKGEERLRPNFFVGFALAMGGIILISYNGSFVLKLNPLGDLLGLAAAISWAVYSVLLRRISDWGLHMTQVTRRIFFYGVILTIPAAAVAGFSFDLSRLGQLPVLGSMLYLGLGASALGFVLWNYCIRVLGAVQTSVYIYAIPVVTVIGSTLFLNEPLSLLLAGGLVLTIAGLAISELRLPKRK